MSEMIENGGTFETWEEKTLTEQIRDTLEERKTTHGDYTRDAECAMATLQLWGLYNWSSLTPVQQHALTMIAFKAARILTGNPNFKDHWHDISGYATLVEDRL